MRKTNLAGNSGLNYSVCLRYLNFMKMLSWLNIYKEDNIEQVKITETGRRLIPVLKDYLTSKIPGDSQHDAGKLSKPVEFDKEITSELGNIDRTARLRKENELSQNEEITTDPFAAKEKSFRKKVPNILLIDDEPDVLLTYRAFLTTEGYSVDAFEDPESAFLRFASMKPGYYDLIITDIRMNRLNGLQLYQRIKALDPSAKVIFVTELDAAEELVTILSPQPAILLRKPIEQKVFNSCVRSNLAC